MIPVSDEYLKLTESNIRPKCEPVITVSGTDVNGNDIKVVWRANNIKDLTFKRGIDPIGRELPYMELTWTEIYTGKLNKESYPEKYNNIMQHMLVELEFIQDLPKENLGTWQKLKKYWTWHRLRNKTWQQVKESDSQEIIKMPKMFLVARPVIKDKTITWTARDLLYFFNSTQIGGIGIGSVPQGINIYTFLGSVILNERGAYLGSEHILNGIKKTALSLAENEEYEIEQGVILSGTTKDILLNVLKYKSLYMTFYDDIIKFEKDYAPYKNYIVRSNVMYEFPKITNGTDISQYQYKRHIWQQSKKTKLAQPIEMQIMGVDFVKWFFDGYGVLAEEIDGNFWADVNYVVDLKDSANDVVSLEYYPLEDIESEEFIQLTNVGEAFVENNPFWVFDKNSEEVYTRAQKLKNYFSSNNDSLEFTSLPNLAIEPNDIISVETNLYDGEKAIFKDGVITEVELKYNGVLKETFKVHEVVL